ncbi:uncharacterized protein LOC108459156 [Gossypium arboreum]|nr:uncharacterized protein LOC108459156 [Gossypium arboreum]
MTPLLMAARQGYDVTVSKILSLCPDCCEKVDNKGLNLLHYQAFRHPLRQMSLEPWIEEYGSVRNLMELEGSFGMKPQEVKNAFGSEKHHHKQKQIKELLEEIQNDQVAEEPVRPILLPTTSPENLDKTREAQLIVAALIATVAFAAAITVPGGLESEKGSEQGTPFLIHEAAFKAFVVTNALAFIFSISALIVHLEVLDRLLSGVVRREKVLNRARYVTVLLGYATVAMVVAFSTGGYVVLKPSHVLAIVTYLICPVFILCMWLFTSK